MAGIIATVFLTIIVFLIVFFVSWGLKIRVLSALTLASVISLFFMLLCYPPVINMSTISDIILRPGWELAYWIIMFILLIYILTYTLFVAVYDNSSRKELGDCPSSVLLQLEGDY